MRHALFVLALAVMCLPAAAQIAEFPYDLASGTLTNPGPGDRTVWTGVVQLAGAPSLQIRFSTIELGDDRDLITVTGTLDGSTQHFDRFALRQWYGRSAWFNGEQVTISVRLTPGSQGEVDVASVLSEAPHVEPDSICGNDDRVLSTNPRVCRLVGSGYCTGWLIDNGSTILTAAHCFSCPANFGGCGATGTTPPGALVTAEFNVPASSSSGSVNHPPAQDQYPVNQTNLHYSSLSPYLPDNWLVAKLNNSNGMSASERQGAWFIIENSLPPTGTPIQTTGHGADSGTSGNYAQQSSSGPLTGTSGNVLNHRSDTALGLFGGPIMRDATNLAIGIQTNGGCNASPTSSNSGVSILYPPLQAAIATATGCPNSALTLSTPLFAGCTTQLFSLTPSAGSWNVVGVGPTTAGSDWDLSMGVSASSTAASSVTDFVAANGHHSGSISPVAGTAYRYSGNCCAYVEHTSAATIPVGGSQTLSWQLSSTVVRAWQIDVATAGSYELNTSGDSNLRWRLFAPGSDTAWRPRSSSLANGSVGTQATVTLSTGWHCVVVSRDAALNFASPTAVTVSLCPAGGPVALTGTPASIAAGCSDFSIVATPGYWNVVAISSPSDWNVTMGSVTSNRTGSDCDFVISNGAQGTITPNTGTFTRNSGTDVGMAQHKIGSGASSLDVQHAATLYWGHIVNVHTFSLPSGTYRVMVQQNSSLRWALFNPGTTPAWRTRNNSLLEGQVGGPISQIQVSAGDYALVVFRDGGPRDWGLSYTYGLCTQTSILQLPNVNAATTVTDPCLDFEITPDSGNWNVVGLTSASSDWNLIMGSSNSNSGSTGFAYLISDGGLGASEGRVFRSSGTAPAQIAHPAVSTILLGTTSTTWTTTTALRIFQFDSTGGGTFDIIVSGVSGLQWDLWRPIAYPTLWFQSVNIPNQATGGGGLVNLGLNAGRHAIVVYKNGGTGASGTLAISIQKHAPPPVAASLTPTSVTVGVPGFTVSITGTGFVATSGVTWQVPPAAPVNLTVTSMTATSIQASVPASLIAAPHTTAALVRVTTPPPGGGSSSALPLAVLTPTPAITQVSPAGLTAGSASFTLQVIGTGFFPASKIRWDGTALSSSSYVSPNQLSAVILPALTATGANHSISVATDVGGLLGYVFGPTGSVSNTLPFVVSNPVPVLTSISPTSVAAGGPSFTLSVTGSGFNAYSLVRWNGQDLTTTAQTATTLQATVPASIFAAFTGFNASIRVFNPAPGGGQSSPLTLVIEPPVVVNPANGHTYTLTPVVLGVQEAREWAARRGGYLAAVNDAAEHSFLVTNFHVPFQSRWIGLSDEGTEGVWRWDSGEPMTYTNWCPGEPNNSGNEDHVELGTTISSSSCWNDAPATYTGFNAQRGIVEIPAGTQAQFRKVMITEVTFQAPFGIEITNYALTPVDLSLHTLRWRDGSTVHTSAPLGITAAFGETFTAGADPNPYPGSMPGIRHLPVFTTLGAGNGLAVELLDGAGAVVDTVIISRFDGTDGGPAFGGVFRGVVTLGPLAASSPAASVERIWGLDSDSAGDWTEQPVRTMGTRNRSSGTRGVDPLPRHPVLINEVDPRYVELRNRSGGALNLQDWFLVSDTMSPSGAAAYSQPFSAVTDMADQALIVAGDQAAAPAEMPPGTVFAVSPQPFRHNDQGSEIGLYDKFGRLIDMVRTTGASNQALFRSTDVAPAHPFDFRGGVLRQPPLVAYGRTAGFDTDTGADFREVLARSMGSPNTGFGGSAGFGSGMHLVIERTAAGPGSGVVIVNAGAFFANANYGQLISALPTNGTGPFFGLGGDAISFLSITMNLPPFFGTLDGQGSIHYFWPAGTLTGLRFEVIFLAWTGLALDRTLVQIYQG